MKKLMLLILLLTSCESKSEYYVTCQDKKYKCDTYNHTSAGLYARRCVLESKKYVMIGCNIYTVEEVSDGN